MPDVQRRGTALLSPCSLNVIFADPVAGDFSTGKEMSYSPTEKRGLGQGSFFSSSPESRVVKIESLMTMIFLRLVMLTVRSQNSLHSMTVLSSQDILQIHINPDIHLSVI